jgi:cysteinyl-tRNA synthetase
MQAHYRSTLDFSNEGLQAAEKGLARMNAAIVLLDKLKVSPESTFDVLAIRNKCYESLNDDMNTAITISHLFDAVRLINSVYAETEKISEKDLIELKQIMNSFVFEILGLKAEEKSNDGDIDGLMQLILLLRADAKSKKDFPTSDRIRDELNKLNYSINDGKNGTTWTKG